MQIYFAENGEGKIKIGISRNAFARIAQIGLSESKPLTLIGVVEGDLPRETAIHRKLRAYRIRGEWYRDCDEVRAVIQNSINNFKVIVNPGEVEQARAERTPPVFAAVAKLLWPNKTDAHLAAIAGVSDRTARNWLSGIAPPPWPVIRVVIDRMFEPI